MKLHRFFCGRLILFLLINFTIHCSVWAEQIFVPTEPTQPINVQLEYFEDLENKLTIKEIKNKAESFLPLKNLSQGFGKKSILWLRFKVDTRTIKDPYWFLTQGYEHVGRLTLYYPSDSGYQQIDASEKTLIRSREFRTHNFIFQIPNSRSIAEYYIRYEPAGHNISIDLRFHSTQGLVEYIDEQQTFIGFFFGGMLVIWAYNAILFLIVRNKAYLYYLYYLGCFIILFGYINGYAPYFVPVTPIIDKLFCAVAFGTIHGMSMFARNFLDLQNSRNSLNNYLSIYEWVIISGGVVAILLPFPPFSILLPFLFFTIILLVVVVVLRILDGYAPAKLYASGWVFLFIALAAYALQMYGFLKPSLWRNYGVMVAALGEAIIFSTSLAYRIKLATEAADLAKNAFLGMISHELRTPLQTIVSSIDILSYRGATNGKNAEVWAHLKNATDHLELQVKDLTDFSRLGSGKLQLSYTTFNAAKIIEEIAENHRPMAQGKGLTYEVDMGGPCIVRSDAIRIQQIVNNLVANAIKYTDAGRVTVRCFHVEEKPNWLVIQVQDSGIGIETKKISKLFEPFTQADEAGARTHTGMGMGLAIVQQLVSLLHGSISVESALCEGTKIEVRIPVAMEEVLALPVKNETSPILLVDDTKDVLISLKEIIEQLGYCCDVASSGQAAIDKIKIRRFAAILLDVNMPNMDGISVAKKIRSDGRNKDVPIVWISATAPEQQSQDQNQFFSYFLEKPIRKEKLRALLQEILV